MVRPLYRDSASNYEPDCSNAGLWYDKFCDQWQSGWTLPAQQKAEWISQLANGRPIGDQSLIAQHVGRQKDMVEKSLNGVCVQLHSESRFVTGLGQEHPVENGFAWHPTLGVPYLPGSGIKGLLRAWARDWEDDQERRSQIDAILGAGDIKDNQKGKVGSVIIFDALPTRSVRLEADVMTPHYDDYYQKGHIPGDWISPVPIPFLVVAVGTPFLFSFATRTPAANEYLPIVEDWLKAALQWLGAGAKTSVGYGRFAETSSEIAASSAEAKTQTTVPQVQVQKSIDLPTPNKGTVEAVLLTEKTKKGGWKARHVATGISGPVQNTNEVPLDKQAGDTLSLIVASAKPSEIAFRYPTDAELERAGRSKEKAKSKNKTNRKG
ncbi:type III-B CRISPR module RAMP protein Cmr6 [Planctomicrobium sp. SH664]|uniref:type III-B CRISPR module RAMP protein Cmr6 n=1 Tax=Planctomicrobium sp. SH664 TaxID=3448125 RepID=UPI003F5AFD2E